jgi:signal transduction histidine kinase
MHGKTATHLKNNIEKVMANWQSRALAEVSSAASAETLALRNSLPIYLEHLSQALADNRKMDISSIQLHDEESVRIGKLHGEDRAGTPSYLLTEVIFEYHILREVIFQVLETEKQLIATERDIILDSIEQAVNDAAVKFSDVHSDIRNKFISTLTHDLKNPLTVAKVNAQLILKRSERPNDCIRSAGRIIGSINRVDSMVHNLLDASRIRAGEKLNLKFGPCDLASILRDVVDEFCDVHDRAITLNSVPQLNGNYGGDGFRRAVENLIGNAAKYSLPGPPITIELRKTKEDVILSVHNFGPIIAPADRDLLFQQYRRTKSAEESSNTGWGIGLTLVKGVAEAHGGSVIVESSEKDGTTFGLQFPAVA